MKQTGNILQRINSSRYKWPNEEFEFINKIEKEFKNLI